MAYRDLHCSCSGNDWVRVKKRTMTCFALLSFVQCARTTNAFSSFFFFPSLFLVLKNSRHIRETEL